MAERHDALHELEALGALLSAQDERSIDFDLVEADRAASTGCGAAGRVVYGYHIIDVTDGVAPLDARNVDCSARGVTGRRQARRHIERMMDYAFIAPDLVKAISDGRLPRGVTAKALADAPALWSARALRKCLVEPGGIEPPTS